MTWRVEQARDLWQRALDSLAVADPQRFLNFVRPLLPLE